jgi:hypothetical protein
MMVLSAGVVQAQLQVDLEIKRNLFIRYEPILVTVSITNFSGQTVFLEDRNGQPWFGFTIQMKDGRPIPPRSPDYGKDPVVLEAGHTLRRQINLTPLYGLDDYGTYNIQATVRDGSGRFYSSRPQRVEMSEGRVIWQQVVGHPDDGTTRQLFLLTHRLPASTALYLRIMDSDRGKVFATHRLGTFLTYDEPQVLLDQNNQVHILHLRAPKSYIYSHIGLNGEIIDRKSFSQARTKPMLERSGDGRIMVVGGAIFDPAAEEAEAAAPGLSERPVPLPGAGGPPPRPAAQPTPSAPPEKKGGLNLWPFQRREPATPSPTPRS